MPLFALSIAFIAGILAAKAFPQLQITFSCLLVLSLAWLIFDLFKHHRWWKKFSPIAPALILGAFAVGGIRLILSQPTVDPTRLAWYNDRGTVTLTGWIVEPPDVRESGVYLRMTFSEVEGSPSEGADAFDRRISGDALVVLPVGASFKMGDILRFDALPRTPSANLDFSYRDYLSRKGIYTVIYFSSRPALIGSHPVFPVRAWLEALRQSARVEIFKLFPQPESGLLSGILLGLDNDLPDTLSQAYRDTGTAHIIAISGFNMAVIAAVFMMLCSRAFNPYLASLVSALGLVLYSAMVGGSPSVIRAAVMAIVAMGGHLIGRGSQGATALGFTAALMCAFDPQLIWDTSFQLSFAATAGLVIFGTPLSNWAEGVVSRFVPEEHVPSVAAPLTDYFLLTLSAQFATLPIIAIQFGRVSLSALLANPLVLPVQSAVLVAGGVATIGGMLFQPLGKALALFAWPLLAYTNRTVEWISRLVPGAISIDPRLGLGIGVLCASAFVLFTFRERLKVLLGRISFTYLCLSLAAVLLTIWTGVLQRPDGNLHVDLIRAGESINLTLTSPEGQKLAIDPLGSVDELTSAISRSMSPLQHQMDVVLLTNRAAAKSLASFNEQLPVSRLLLAPSVTLPLENTPPITVERAILSVNVDEGDVISLGDSTTVRILASNADATALLIEYQNCRILIPGGIDPMILRQADPRLSTGLTAILLTPGDLAFVPPAWWSRWNAQWIVWLDASIPPDRSWTSLNGYSSLSLVSDGKGYSVSIR